MVEEDIFVGVKLESHSLKGRQKDKIEENLVEKEKSRRSLENKKKSEENEENWEIRRFEGRSISRKGETN